MPPPPITRDVARRLLLDAQGLLDDPARALTPARLRSAIEEMGFVQIDSINTIERAHHLTLASRFDAYRPAHLAKLLEHTRELFEQWTHDAAAIPTKWFPHWQHRFARERRRIPESAWWTARVGKEGAAILEQVRKRIVEQGPVLSKDFERERVDLEPGGWWSWKPEKAALEHLWRTGTLSVARRINFQKVYDLTERVLPEQHALPPPSEEEHLDWACSTALDRLGVATPTELAQFWNMVPNASAASWCEARAKEGAIVEVRAEGREGDPVRRAYAPLDWKRRADRAPEAPDRIRLLSPFDPILRDRKRALRLFDFDYHFEAFTPAPKRKYGYYVLPMLERDRLVGRIDPKLHREEETIEVRGVWWEPGVRVTKKRKAALAEALERLGAMAGATKIRGRLG